MASLITRNGTFHSLFDPLADEEEGPCPATAMRLGSPLMIRYLYFRLHHKDRGRQQILISTFLKTEEAKAAASEAVNYFNPSARFSRDGVYTLSDFGGRHYGHPLCYYTRSYLGESIRLTTKVMELDRLDRKTLRSIRSGLGLLARLPVFTEYLAYAALVYTGLRAAEKILEYLARDDAIIESHSIDLHFTGRHARRLQPGRIICLPGEDGREFLDSEAFFLAPDNRLREAATGREYDRGPYFVLEVSAQSYPAYEDFEYHQGMAELLRKTQRGENPSELVDAGVEVMRGYRDYRLIEELEEMLLAREAEPSRERAMALYRLLSPRMRHLYEARLEKRLSPKK